MKEKSPNLVWIVSDQHRFCDVGYNGNPDVETPNLDWLAEKGVDFTATYSSCPLCVPARGSLLTGLHALHHGAAANDLPIRPNCESIATVLNKAGYETAYIGKWHLGGVPREAFIPHYNRLDFQYWRGNNCNHNYLKGYYDDESNMRHMIDGYAPIGETDLALEYLEKNRDKEKPFALFLNYSIPHDPYFLLPEGDLERYTSKKLKMRKNLSSELQPGEAGADNFEPHKCYAGYYAHIRQLDIQIGRVIERLKKLGIYENSIILYASDHGDMLGSHGYLNKQIFYDESARVPFIIHWPGHVQPGKRECAIGLVDVAPTILGLMGLKFDGKTDGEDLSHIVRYKENDKERYVYFYSYVPCHQAVNRKYASWRAVSNGKIMLAVDDQKNALAMYDMVKDPYQMQDCKDLAQYQEEKSRLLGVLDEFVKEQDGYYEWPELLKQYQLEKQWEESEIFFRHFFANFFMKMGKEKV